MWTLICLAIGAVIGAFVWDYAGEDIKTAIMNRK
jgi:hypothetical protein